jgi:outer membrane protein assembly factor BamB
MRMHAFGVVLILFYSLSAAAEVTGWRGNGNGVHPHATPPAKFEDAAWKTAVGYSYSSPVVSGSMVLVTSEPNVLLCVNAADGKILWKKKFNPALLPADRRDKVKTFFDDPETSGNAASTPVCDGKHVYVVLGNGLVVCCAIKDGSVKWVQHIDTEPNSDEGRSASPLLAGGKLIVHLTELIALDPATGKTLWKQPDAEDAYGTPAAGKIGEVDVIATPMGSIIRLSDGKVLAKELAELTYASPVIQNGTLYMIGIECAAFKLPDKVVDDKVTAQKIWTGEVEDDVYSSPVIIDGILYVIANDGILTAFDMKNKTKADLDTGLGGEEIKIYSSISAVGKHLYMFNHQGIGVIVKTGKKPEKIGKIGLDEGSGGTPAFSSNRMFVRCGESLCCYEGKQKAGPKKIEGNKEE